MDFNIKNYPQTEYAKNSRRQKLIHFVFEDMPMQQKKMDHIVVTIMQSKCIKKGNERDNVSDHVRVNLHTAHARRNERGERERKSLIN